MNLYPDPAFEPIPVKAVIPLSLGTRSQRINPWIPSDKPAATVCKADAGYELKEAEINPTKQMYRVLTGQDKSKHFWLVRVNRDRRRRSRKGSDLQQVCRRFFIVSRNTWVAEENN